MYVIQLSFDVVPDPLHATKSYQVFRDHFKLVNTSKSVPFFEIFHFLEIGQEGGIVQPQVTYHGIESDVEPGITNHLKEGLCQEKDTGWTFDLVPFVMRTVDEVDHVGEDKMRLHIMKNKTLSVYVMFASDKDGKFLRFVLKVKFIFNNYIV